MVWSLTTLYAGEGDCALADEVVAGHAIIILHNKAHQCKLRHVQVKLEILVPHGVETLEGEKKGESVFYSKAWSFSVSTYSLGCARMSLS